MNDTYEWAVTDLATRRDRATYRNVEAAFAAKGPQDRVFLVLRATGFRVPVLRAA